MMKVAFAGSVLDPRWTGGEPKVASSVERGLTEMGVQVARVCFRGLPNERLRPLLRFRLVSKPSDLLDIALDIESSSYLRYLKEFRRSGPDRVVCWYDYDLSALKAASDLKIPTTLAVHIYWPVCPITTLWNLNLEDICPGPKLLRCLRCQSAGLRCGWIRRMAAYVWEARYGTFQTVFRRPKLLQAVDTIVVPSHFIRTRLARYGLDERKIEVIHNGIDVDKYSPPERTATDLKKKRVLYLGHPGAFKGYVHFVKAAQAVTNRRHDVEFAATNLEEGKGSGGVVGLGYLSEDALVEELRHAYMVVVPSLWDEPFGLAALEAMGCAKPILAYRSGAISEIVKHGETGILVPRGSLDELISAAVHMLDNEDLARIMGERGRARAEKHFGLRMMVRKYYEVISAT